jgi:hypothetical protein
MTVPDERIDLALSRWWTPPPRRPSRFCSPPSRFAVLPPPVPTAAAARRDLRVPTHERRHAGAAARRRMSRGLGHGRRAFATARVQKRAAVQLPNPD